VPTPQALDVTQLMRSPVMARSLRGSRGLREKRALLVLMETVETAVPTVSTALRLLRDSKTKTTDKRVRLVA